MALLCKIAECATIPLEGHFTSVARLFFHYYATTKLIYKKKIIDIDGVKPNLT